MPDTTTVHFLPDNLEIKAPQGENLLWAAMEAGVHINASCGGSGVCGQCRVIIEKGTVESEKTEKLSEQEYSAGYRQACKTKVISDVVVRIPPESYLDRSILDRPPKGLSGKALKAFDLDLSSLMIDQRFVPPFQKMKVRVKAPTAEDNISDLARLLREIKTQHGLGNISVGMAVIKDLCRNLREKDWEVTVTVAPSWKKTGKIRLINVEPGDTTAYNYGIAVDVGTTTISGQLLDLSKGIALDQYSDYNGQIGYGADVISRIAYSQTPGGLKRLQEVVVSTINGIIKELLAANGVDVSSVSHLTISGNTTMTQLLLGLDPKYVREAPYTPTTNYYPPVRAQELGLDLGPHVYVYLFPCVASYVGGDIVAGVLACGMYDREELTLFIDIGTNGEIVVGNKDWLACAACSAGPAFEGGGIKFGMRATSGAIEGFSLNPLSYEPMIITIGMKKPKGICGSGLINIVAELLEKCVLDRNGKFNMELNIPHLREGPDGNEIVLVEAENTAVGKDIVLTEVDIDNLIRAKAAMYAGYLTLLEGVGLSINDVKKVILAGAFGSFIDLEKAVTIGLLPDLDKNKFFYIGNASLMGAKIICFSNELRTQVRGITEMMTNFELSQEPAFMDRYVAAMFLPHTDERLFRSVADRIDCRDRKLLD
jgi:uncharacterized 2Fe-2S/4Fe-4S cluster protein (DUF4445 family)